MNDDPSASTTADQPQLQDAYPIADADILQWEDSGPTSADSRERQRIRRRLQKKRKVEMLEDIIRNLDIMIFCELSILYYMDCSLFRFLIRAFVEWVYFTPKPKMFPEPAKHRPYVEAIFGSNIICVLLHIFSAKPEAGEAMRGYLHGGILIDFVGQEGPISKTRLIFLDFLTLALQLLVFAAFLERQNMRIPITSSEATSTAAAAATAESTSEGQDLDSEERGILRPDPNTFDDIELQPLTSSAGRTGGDEDGERAELLSEPQPLDVQDSINRPLDAFYTGEHVITDLHILDSIRSQWWQSGASTSGDSSSSTAAMAASLAGSRLGVRFRIGGRELGSS
ncbi:MAG: hypothetical protein M1830_007631 [Pleopsidium flavum]|nr:MAG: hypothetical protein M1830_007631 [Pleopsidium flavum]